MVFRATLKSGNYDPSECKSWNVLETVLSHLNSFRVVNSYQCHVTFYIVGVMIEKKSNKLSVLALDDWANFDL